MTSQMNNSVEKPAELLITRIFNAPRKLVWKVWTEPERMKRWWGPKNFTMPSCMVDFRVGGKFLCCMRSPESQDFWCTGVYKEIIKHERIVCTDSFADEKGNVVSAQSYGMSGDWPAEALLTVIFEEFEGKTKLTLRHVGIPSADHDCTSSGWNESLDKLAEVLK